MLRRGLSLITIVFFALISYSYIESVASEFKQRECDAVLRSALIKYSPNLALSVAEDRQTHTCIFSIVSTPRRPGKGDNKLEEHLQSWNDAVELSEIDDDIVSNTVVPLLLSSLSDYPERYSFFQNIALGSEEFLKQCIVDSFHQDFSYDLEGDGVSCTAKAESERSLIMSLTGGIQRNVSVSLVLPLRDLV